ncbi:hypothetical protein Aperf_G00000063364 [Anoplocephala perfoliata]
MSEDPALRSEYGDHLFGTSELNLANSSAIEGLPDEQRTSPIRRTFLLFLLFELVLIIALWLSYLRSLGDFSQAMADQVFHMKFNTSLFDVQVIAFGRFSFLEVVYGVCLTSHRWPSAVWTAITTTYMLVKCVFFASSQRGEPLAYTELILPIVTSWLGTLFLECRVLPQEKRAKIVNTLQRPNPDFLSAVDVHSTQFHSVQRWATEVATSCRVASIYGSPEASLIMDPESLQYNPSCYGLEDNDATVDVAALLTRAALLRQTTWSVYNDEAWNEVSTSTATLTEPHITSASVQSFGKQTVFRMDALLCIRSKTMYDDLVNGFEFSPIWNSSISSARCLQKFPHEDLDVVHIVVKEVLGGIIKSRDFVVMRAWGTKDGIHYVTSSSVTHPKCPPSNDCIRADQLINSLFLRPSGNLCHFTFITCLDLKGRIPGYLLWKGTKASLSTLYQDLRRRVVTLNNGEEDHEEALECRRPVLEEAC